MVFVSNILKRYTQGMNPKSALMLIIALGSISPNLARSQTTVWNLSSDWSDSSNPNGVWAYKASPTTTSSSQILTMSGDSFSSNPTAQMAWTTGNPSAPPVWFKVSSAPDTVYPGVTPNWQVGDVITHTNTGYSDVSWTSSINGVVDITGAIWPVRSTPETRSNDWSIYVGSSFLTGGTDDSTFSRSSPFNFSLGSNGASALNGIAVSVGTVIDLRISPEGGGVDYAGVNFTVSAIPEPSTYAALFGLCALGFAAYRRRYRQAA